MESEHGFHFVGDSLSLDFLNTRIKEEGEYKELLSSLTAFVDWLNLTGVFDEDIDPSLIDEWGSNDREEALNEIKEFREQLRDVIDVVIDGGTPSEEQLSPINSYRNRLCWTKQLTRENGGVSETQVPSPEDPLDLCNPIANDAAELLTESDWSLIKRCDNPECVLYFYDTTKNHSRRWCSMDLCGNRMKARRHYERQKDSAQE